jgi:DNA-binding transcriptional MerR regulator
MATPELTIGHLAKRTATNVQTIRFYEQKGLMPRPGRSTGGQRRYMQTHADRLAFIRHARELGFPLEAVRELLGLVDKPDQSCARVDHVAQEVLLDVEAKIARLESLRSELKRMIRQGRHGRVKDCRIVEVLADHSHSQCLTKDHASQPRSKKKSRG